MAETSPGDARATERLHEYWVHGEGAAKIRWGEPDDFRRCVDHLGKYIADPEGYCDLAHHAATGMWPAQHAAMEKKATGRSAEHAASAVWDEIWAEIRRVGPHGYIHGWIKAGAPAASPHAAATLASAEKYIASMQGKVKPRELNNYDVGRYERETLNPAFHYMPEQEKAIRHYTENGYQEINDSARSGGSLSAEARALSSAMQPLPEDLVLLREVGGAQALGHVSPGDVIHDQGFSSTTLIGRGRFAVGKSDTTVMHILTPKGTPVVWADAASDYPEDEMVLDRGQPMIVMKKQQRAGRSDVTDVYLLVLPKENPN
jgi:hypothetical protein